jgi:hypothetical protein
MAFHNERRAKRQNSDMMEALLEEAVSSEATSSDAGSDDGTETSTEAANS